MSTSMNEELAAAALRLFHDAADNLFERDQVEAIACIVGEGITAFGLGSLDLQVVALLQRVLQLEILYGYGSMARLWLWQYEVECRSATLSMIDIALGSASPFRANPFQIEDFAETCDRFSHTSLDVADHSKCNACSIAVARVVETAWVTVVCEIVGKALPEGSEPEFNQFAIFIASIFRELEEQIEAIQDRFE